MGVGETEGEGVASGHGVARGARDGDMIEVQRPSPATVRTCLANHAPTRYRTTQLDERE